MSLSIEEWRSRNFPVFMVVTRAARVVEFGVALQNPTIQRAEMHFKRQCNSTIQMKEWYDRDPNLRFLQTHGYLFSIYSWHSSKTARSYPSRSKWIAWASPRKNTFLCNMNLALYVKGISYVCLPFDIIHWWIVSSLQTHGCLILSWQRHREVGAPRCKTDRVIVGVSVPHRFPLSMTFAFMAAIAFLVSLKRAVLHSLLNYFGVLKSGVLLVKRWIW